MISRAYKFRIYPNKTQAELIEETFRACRYVWNIALECKKVEWDDRGKNVSAYELMKLLTGVKSVCTWLYDVPNSAMQQSIRDLDVAFKNFFRRVKNGEKPGYPKFKKAGCSFQSYRTPAAGNAVRVIDDRHVKLPKLGKVKCRITQTPQGHLLSATVSRTPSGKYFCSITCENVPEPYMEDGTLDVMGVRLGVRDLITCSDGVRVENPRALSKSERKLRREQRRLSRKKRGSANYRKQKQKVALVHERVANQRRDNIHKATTRIVRDSKAIAVSSNDVAGMMRSKKFSKAVADASMSEVKRQLAYKAQWYGRDLVEVDASTAFGSTCGRCGAQAELKVGTTRWTCPKCGAHHDYALNAARNIAAIGMAEIRRGGRP